MHKVTFLRVIFCVLSAASFLFFYLEKQNEKTKLLLEIPHLSASLKEIEEENMRLQYLVDRFENPANLMELMVQTSFSHLQFPVLDSIVVLPEGKHFAIPNQIESKPYPAHSRPIAFGARH